MAGAKGAEYELAQKMAIARGVRGLARVPVKMKSYLATEAGKKLQ